MFSWHHAVSLLIPASNTFGQVLKLPGVNLILGKIQLSPLPILLMNAKSPDWSTFILFPDQPFHQLN
jgi:hypothetical protein